MKTALTLLTALVLAHSAFAATHAVLPGGSIQEKVDLAQPGDIVAIFGGTYPGDVIVNKAIRLAEVDGQDVTITGNVTFTGITNAPPFEGFTVGSSGKGISISNTTSIVLKNIDTRPGAGVTINGTSKVGITGGFYSQISQNGGELTTTLTQVTGNFNTTINAQKTVAFRSTVSGTQNWNSNKAWIGYSTGKTITFAGTNCQIVVVACTFDGGGTFAPIVDFQGQNNRGYLLNSIIKGAQYASYYWHPAGSLAYVEHHGTSCVTVSGLNSAVIANNYMRSSNVSHTFSPINGVFDGSSTQGLGVYSTSASCTVFNNIVSGCWRGVSLPFGASLNSTFFQSVNLPIQGGVVPYNILSGDPLFAAGQERQLQPSSPCVNSGVNDPIYNDLNGTRNDIGPSGGCLFDPDGWTTANPVVISFDLASQQLLKGVDTQVTLSNGQAVSQP